MRFNLQVHTRELPGTLREFIAIPGWVAWKARLDTLERARQRLAITGDDFKEVHAIEFELARLHHRKQATGQLPTRIESNEMYRFAALSTAAVEMYRQLSATGRNRLRGMLLDALKTDFRSIEHELHVATHLVARGYDVEPVDMEGQSRFDFLATKEGLELEVECKSVSYDQGRKVHIADFNVLAERLHPICKSYVDKQKESKLIVLTLRERLDTSDELLARICSYVRDVLELGRDHVEDADLSIDSRRYHAKKLPPDLDAMRDEIEQQLQSFQLHIFLYGDFLSAVIFVARSQRPDRVLTYLHRQMKDAANQFTRKRPAVVCVQVQGVYPDEWRSLAKESSLQVMTNRYLHSPSRSHVHTVTYSSTGWLEREASAVTERHAVLHFQNANHPLRTDTRARIFGPDVMEVPASRRER